MAHPWMIGTLLVQVAEEEEPVAEHVVMIPSTDETTVTGIASDGELRVEITASNPAANESMTIDLKFRTIVQD
ncbi:MAG: hypothetical protein ACR2LL_10675 [Nitrosopumilus sp.]